MANKNTSNMDLQTVCGNTRYDFSIIHDDVLKQNAETIQKAFIAAEVSQGTLAVAFADTAAHIAANPDCGFTDIQDFGLRVFGLKKSQSYALAQIGKYQTAITDNDGKVLYYTDSFTPIPDKPFGNSVLQKLVAYSNKYGFDNIKDYVNKSISPDLSFRAVVDKLKEFDKMQAGTIEQKSGENTGENTGKTTTPAKSKEENVSITLPKKVAIHLQSVLSDFSADYIKKVHALKETDSDKAKTMLDKTVYTVLAVEILKAANNASNGMAKLDKLPEIHGLNVIPGEYK